jgi:ATP-dependent helicase/nuclease subunit A
MVDAARRGKLLHALFERLPAVAPQDRTHTAEHWLEYGQGVADPMERRALVDAACAIIDDPDHAAIFSPDTLAEAPLAAIVGDHVISGTVDRLLISEQAIRIVDFKTGRRVPKSAAAVPDHHLKQMAAYAAAVAIIFPDRTVSAALLYTSGPVLIDLPHALLEQNKPGLTLTKENQSPDH